MVAEFGKMALEFAEKSNRIIAGFVLAAIELLFLYHHQPGLGNEDATTQFLVWVVCLGGSLLLCFVVKWGASKILAHWATKKAKAQQAEAEKIATLQRDAESEAQQEQTLHYLERLESDETLVLAWMVQTQRDYFTYKSSTNEVDRLTERGILVGSDKVAFYREMPQFVLARVRQMDQLKRVWVPKDVPWMYDGPIY